MTAHVWQPPMNRRPLGALSGLEVSEVGLGLWAVSGSEWGPVQDEENLQAFDAALESGVTFADTPDVYGGGHSEELLGRALRCPIRRARQWIASPPQVAAAGSGPHRRPGCGPAPL